MVQDKVAVTRQRRPPACYKRGRLVAVGFTSFTCQASPRQGVWGFCSNWAPEPQVAQFGVQRRLACDLVGEMHLLQLAAPWARSRGPADVCCFQCWRQRHQRRDIRGKWVLRINCSRVVSFTSQTMRQLRKHSMSALSVVNLMWQLLDGDDGSGIGSIVHGAE